MLTYQAMAIAAGEGDLALQALDRATVDDVSVARAVTRALAYEILCRKPTAADVEPLAEACARTACGVVAWPDMFGRAILTETLTRQTGIVYPEARWRDELAVHGVFAAAAILRLRCQPTHLHRLEERLRGPVVDPADGRDRHVEAGL